ncbi:MAG TPA: DMT family protein [Tepidisphaeraceae bacterium]|jgi:hypothetical protein
MLTILLLTISNVFMTIAWYGHLTNTKYPLWKTVLVSWSIAFVEYCFMVPANRYGYTWSKFTAPQLKVIQEVITLVVFGVFTTFVLKDKLHWNHFVGFSLILLAVFFVFHDWKQPTAIPPQEIAQQPTPVQRQ